MNAQQEVERLLAQIRVLTNNPAVVRASDQIEVLTRAYMEPPETFLPDIHFTRAERRMLDLLRSRVGKTVSRDALQDASGFDRTEPAHSKTLDVQLCRLRAKLKQFAIPYHIETDYGTGFRLCEGRAVRLAPADRSSAKYLMQSRAA
jgi:DNA-binding response OmpR family regulator